MSHWFFSRGDTAYQLRTYTLEPCWFVNDGPIRDGIYRLGHVDEALSARDCVLYYFNIDGDAASGVLLYFCVWYKLKDLGEA